MTMNISSMVGSDVADRVKRQFGDESGAQITTGDLIRWINDGQREIVTKNKILKAKATTESVADQADYTFPDQSVWQIESIHYKDRYVPAKTYHEAEQAIMNGGPDVVYSGTPAFWYEWAGVVTFWPTPRADGDKIAILYTRVPEKLASIGSALSVPDKYFESLCRYVLAQAYELDENWDASSYKSQEFNANLDLLAEEERTSSQMTYPTISILEY